jgi:MarR family transcriptional regulator for hemolysin
LLSYDFEQSIGYWLVRASQAYERAMNAELAPRGITLRQCQVLGCLALYGELSQTELAERVHVEPPTLVGILDRMERDGWISRHDCATDRRKKMIRPQPQAEPVWSEITDCARRVRARATSTLSPEQLAQLKELLGHVLESLAADPADTMVKEPI